MVKKIIVSALIVILLGAVGVGVYDAYSGQSTFELPQINLNQLTTRTQGQGQGNGGGGGQGQRRGQGGQGGGSSPQAMQHTWVTLTGAVISTDAQSLTVDTAEQGQLTVSLGEMGFADTQGVTFNPGDAVTLMGFEGDTGQFQAGQITNTTTGQMLLLRDPNGRPLWAGPGRNGQGQGGGQQAQARGQGQGPGLGGNHTGTPLAAGNDWLTVEGAVVSAHPFTVDTAEYGQLSVQLGPPWFADTQGVVFNPGDSVTLLGFAGQGAAFQAGQITNNATGQVLMLRDPNSRPLWAGQGQGGQGGGQGRQQGNN